MINIQEIKLNHKGEVQEVFTTNNPRIKSVTFTYLGQDNDLDKFLQSLILKYGENKKLIA